MAEEAPSLGKLVLPSHEARPRSRQTARRSLAPPAAGCEAADSPLEAPVITGEHHGDTATAWGSYFGLDVTHQVNGIYAVARELGRQSQALG